MGALQEYIEQMEMNFRVEDGLDQLITASLLNLAYAIQQELAQKATPAPNNNREEK